jgi:PAS domain S-box-containing protein
MLCAGLPTRWFAPTSGFRELCQVPASDLLTSHFFSIFHRAMVGIAYTSANGSILEANRKFCEMLGYTAAKLHSLATGELTHPDDCRRHEQLTLELVAGQRSSISHEQRLVRKSGEAFWSKRMASRVEGTRACYSNTTAYSYGIYANGNHRSAVPPERALLA